MQTETPSNKPKSRIPDDVVRAELENDPTNLGYKQNGVYRSASYIGHLLVTGGAGCRMTVLWGGGAVDLAQIERITGVGD